MIHIILLSLIFIKVLLIMIDLLDFPQYIINNYIFRYVNDTKINRIITYMIIFVIMLILYLKFI